MKNVPQVDTPKVQIINNQAMTSSLDVADFFGKRPADVLRDIKQLIDDEPEFSERNFALAEYIDEQGKPRPYYDMSRDGFTFIVMGYTGEKARKFKIAYIQAFNLMEAELSGKPLQLDTPTTAKDRKPITDMINTLVSVAPFAHPAARAMLNAHLGVEHAEDITLAQIPVAVAFLQEQINMHTARVIPHDNDPQAGIITDMAMQGITRFSLDINIGADVAKDTKINLRRFNAEICLREVSAVSPYGATFSIAPR